MMNHRLSLHYSSSAILQLPIDVVHLVADHLPSHTRNLLSQTCRSLNLGLARRTTRLSRTEHVSYMDCAVRDMPSKWACRRCNELHDISWLDTPITPRLNHTYGPPTSEREVCRYQSYAICQRHIQLALKYTRIGGDSKMRLHLAHLMLHYQTRFYTSDGSNQVLCHFSAVPGIIQGRYVLEVEWCWIRNKRDPARMNLGTLKVCEHQGWDSVLDVGVLGFFSAREWDMTENLEEEEYLVTESTTLLGFQSRSRHNGQVALTNAMWKAFMVPDQCVLGSCPRCPTDFSVEVKSKDVRLTAWRDMGPENGPHQPPPHQFLVNPPVGSYYTFTHPPDSIRKRYVAL